MSELLFTVRRRSGRNYVATPVSPPVHPCNSLIARVCTLLHVNKIFFLLLGGAENHVRKPLLPPFLA
jgi:hypothetical protein